MRVCDNGVNWSTRARGGARRHPRALAARLPTRRRHHGGAGLDGQDGKVIPLPAGPLSEHLDCLRGGLRCVCAACMLWRLGAGGVLTCASGALRAGARGVGAGRCAHICGQDGGGRVRHRKGAGGGQAGGVHLAAQGARAALHAVSSGARVVAHHAPTHPSARPPADPPTHPPTPGAEQPKVSRVVRGVWRRGAADGGCDAKPLCALHGHDHRDPALHDLPRERAAAGGDVGDL